MSFGVPPCSFSCDAGLISYFFSSAMFSAVSSGIWNTPSSVTIPPVMSALGVTSKAGFHMSIPVAVHKDKSFPLTRSSCST